MLFFIHFFETKKEAFSTFLCLSSFQQKWKRKKKFWKLSKENWTKNLSWCVWKIYALIIKLFFSPTMKPLPGLETKGVVFSSHSPPKSLFNEGCHNLRTSSLSLFMLPLWPKLPWLWKKNFSGATFVFFFWICSKLFILAEKRTLQESNSRKTIIIFNISNNKKLAWKLPFFLLPLQSYDTPILSISLSYPSTTKTVKWVENPYSSNLWYSMNPSTIGNYTSWLSPCCASHWCFR